MSIISEQYKTPLSQFVAQNPFPRPFTEGFFFREKMRAIHRVTPEYPYQSILEVGGGQSGLSALLFPQAQITNIDIEPSYAESPLNKNPRIKFICGDATKLPFEDNSFDAITMFDLLEHVPDDKVAINEAFRVLKPGGFLLLSTPNENWRFPYYSFMQFVCPKDTDVMAEWGHVRRGYSLEELEALIGMPCQKTATFINPITVLIHDVAFSNLSPLVKAVMSTFLSPITWGSYSLHNSQTKGTETAYCWHKA